MFKKDLNTKYKKIISVIIILFLVFGFFKKINALTIADVELLISIGMISPNLAQDARDFVNSQKTSSTGSALKTDKSSSKECIVLNQNLVKGNSGTAVSALQRFLKSEGHLPKDQEITGYFGDITVQAVSDFQLATGLISSSKAIGAGTIGPISRKKVQEISCKKAAEAEAVVPTVVEEVAPVVVATTTTVTDTKKPKISKDPKTPKAPKPPILSISKNERKANKSDGEFEFKYSIKMEPDDDVNFFKIILVCDPSAVQIDARDIDTCGEFFEYKTANRGEKVVNLKYKNLSRTTQPIIFGAEALDLNRKVLGVAEIKNDITPAEPKYNFNSGTNSITYSGSVDTETPLCNRQDQLEFIRFSMTTFDPAKARSLPNCWPGDLLCDYAYPATFCQITNGPSSDDLCLKSQKFVNGECVARI